MSLYFGTAQHFFHLWKTSEISVRLCEAKVVGSWKSGSGSPDSFWCSGFGSLKLVLKISVVVSDGSPRPKIQNSYKGQYFIQTSYKPHFKPMQSACKTHISYKTHTKFWKKCKRHLNLIQTEGKRHTKIIFYELCMRFVFLSFGTPRWWSLGLYMSFVFLGVYPPWTWGTSPKIQNSCKGQDFIQTSYKSHCK